MVRFGVESKEQATTQVRCWSDLEEDRWLTEHYFGLRVLITDRSEWTTAQIVEAYRGPSRVEGAFRDLQRPGHAGHSSCSAVSEVALTSLCGHAVTAVLFTLAMPAAVRAE